MKKCVERTVQREEAGITFVQACLLQKTNNAGALFYVLGSLGFLVLAALSVIFFALLDWWLAFVLALYIYNSLIPFCDKTIHELNYDTIFTKKTRYLFFARLFSLLYWHSNCAFFHANHFRHHIRMQLQLSGSKIITSALFIKRQLCFLPFEPAAFVRSGFHLPSLRTIIFLRVPQLTPWQDHVLQTAQSKIVHEIRQWGYITLFFHMAIIITAIIADFWLLPLVPTLAVCYEMHCYYIFIGSSQHSGFVRSNYRFSEICHSIMLNSVSNFLCFQMKCNSEYKRFLFIPFYRLKRVRNVFKNKFSQRFSLLQVMPQMFMLSRELQQKFHLHEV